MPSRGAKLSTIKSIRYEFDLKQPYRIPLGSSYQPDCTQRASGNVHHAITPHRPERRKESRQEPLSAGKNGGGNKLNIEIRFVTQGKEVSVDSFVEAIA